MSKCGELLKMFCNCGLNGEEMVEYSERFTPEMDDKEREELALKFMEEIQAKYPEKAAQQK